MNPGFRCLQGGLFSAVSKADVGNVADEMQKRGVDMLSWADPFMPDAVMPEHVRQKALEQIQEGKAVHYTTPIGSSELKAAIAEKLRRFNGFQVDPERNILITPGSDSGLLFAMMPFLCPGDEVLVPDPSYPSNFLNPKLLGGKTVPVPLYPEDNYQVRIEEFEKRLTPRTKMVLLTHPNNPTTTVYRRESIEALCRFIIDNDLVLVCDQAFEDHIYDGIEFVAPCTLPGMWERTLTVCSISKGIGLSGFRIGYIYACDKIMDVLYGGAVNVLGAACTLSSLGAIAAIKDKEHMRSNYERLERRRRLAYDILSTAPGVEMKMSESGILSWLNISRLGTSAEVADYIMEHAKIMVNQGTPYGAQGEGWLRIVTACFASDEDAAVRFERIKAALTRLAKEKGIA